MNVRNEWVLSFKKLHGEEITSTHTSKRAAILQAKSYSRLKYDLIKLVGGGETIRSTALYREVQILVE